MAASDSATHWESFSARHGGWLLALLTAVLLVPSCWQAPLVDNDESRFSGATLEMIRRGEWVVPYFNGEYRFDKPPLIYWAQRVSFALFGVNELAARLPSIVMAGIIALLIRRMGTRWFSATTGLFAGFAWLTCLQVRIHGRLAVADLLMVGALTASQWAILELLRAPPARRFSGWFWMLYLSQAAGFLAKGPVVPATSALSVLLLRFVWFRRPLAWSALHLPAGLPLSLGLVALWGIPALLKTDGAYWKVGIGHHVIDRGTGAFWQEWSPFYYVFSTGFSLLPWFACAGHGWRRLREEWSLETAFLVSWFVAPILIFTVYATQLMHYVLPGFAGFFLLTFRHPQPETNPPRWERIWFWTVTGGAGLAGLAVAVIAWNLPWSEDFARLRPLAGAIGISIAIMSLAAVGWRFRRASLALVSVAIWSWLNAEASTQFRKVIPAISIAPQVKALPTGAPTTWLGHSDGALVFYTDRIWHSETNFSQLKALLDGPEPRCVVCLRREFPLTGEVIEKIAKGATLDDLTTKADHRTTLDQTQANGFQRRTVSGLNLTRTSWVELEVFLRP